MKITAPEGSRRGTPVGVGSVNNRRACQLLCVLAWFVFAVAVRPQSTPMFRPPDQTYLYGFNGAAKANAPDTAALNLGATFSIEFCMMLDANAPDRQNMGIFGKGVPNDGDPFAAYSLSLLAGTHRLSYIQSTGVPGTVRGAEIGTSLSPGQWYHVAIVNNNFDVTLYLNGQQQAHFTAAGPTPVNSVPLVLGGGVVGSLRQFRIWSRALSAAELASFAGRLLSGSEPGLIADWPLDERSRRDGARPGPEPPGIAPGKDLQPRHNLVSSLEENRDCGRWPLFPGRATHRSQSTVVPGLSIPIDFDSDGMLKHCIAVNR